MTIFVETVIETHNNNLIGNLKKKTKIKNGKNY